MSFDRDRSLLFVPPSTQDHIKGVLNATVVLMMYGDYECFQNADIYRLIKVIQQQLNVSLGENYLCFIFRHFPQIDISKKVYIDRINEGIESGLYSGVTATPALYINGIRYSDHWKIEQLMAAIITASH